ncbi:hypothetical protein VCHC57A2_3191, partial [Vibrio cholerae HC-57A2]
MSENQKVN